MNYSLRIIVVAFVLVPMGVLFPHTNTAEASLLIQRPLYIGLTDGLVGHWSFNGPDMNATQALDRSGNDNHGTLTNGPERVAGKLGQALKFDGVNDEIDMGDVLNFGANQDFTISLWVKSSDTSQDQFALNKRNSTGYQIRYTTGGGFFFRLDDATGITDTAANTTVMDGNWHHIVAGRIASTQFIYVDAGTPNTSAARTGDLTDNTINFQISDQDGANNGAWNGLIDDVRIYNRALSPQEIKRLHKIGGTIKINTTQSIGSVERGLIGHWTFDGAHVNATQALDRSGQGRHGTFVGSGHQLTQGKVGQALSFPT